jgi:hypothetical protein
MIEVQKQILKKNAFTRNYTVLRSMRMMPLPKGKVEWKSKLKGFAIFSTALTAKSLGVIQLGFLFAD